ncbi:MAG: PQQ-binding-like beta-propeller repeat protein [Myxococcota bacterium]|nr:PQQ-binding-like beta-propeller repeat protein [Myxococcota bacterium]
MRHVALSLVLIGLLDAGCAGKQLVSNEWSEPAAVKVVRLRWVKQLYPSLPNYLIPEMGEELDRFNPIETASAGFDTDLGRAFIGASSGALYCIDLKSAQTLWRFEIDDAVGSTPIFDAGRKAVYFGADDGIFYAIHARSGRPLWHVEIGAEIRRKPIFFEDTLYVASADNAVKALDPKTGEIIWQYRRPAVEGFSSAGYAGLTLHASTLITGFSDGYVVAIDTVGGNVLWSQDLAGEVITVSKDGAVALVDVDATPVITKGIAIAASVAGGIQGLNPETGAVKWTRPEITGVTGLAAKDGVIYAARSGFGLSALDPIDGRALWTRRFKSGVLQDPVIHDDVLLISDSEFGLYVVSTLKGDLLQKLDQREGFFARPSIQGGYMLILGNNGTLYATSIM